MKLSDNIIYISTIRDKFGINKRTETSIKAFVDNIVDSTMYSKAGGLESRTMIYITKSDAVTLKCKTGDVVLVSNLQGENQRYAVQKVTNNKKYIGLVV